MFQCIGIDIYGITDESGEVWRLSDKWHERFSVNINTNELSLSVKVLCNQSGFCIKLLIKFLFIKSFEFVPNWHK